MDRHGAADGAEGRVFVRLVGALVVGVVLLGSVCLFGVSALGVGIAALADFGVV